MQADLFKTIDRDNDGVLTYSDILNGKSLKLKIRHFVGFTIMLILKNYQ